MLTVSVYRRGNVLPLLAAFAVLNLLLLSLTVWRVREPPAPGAAQPFALFAFLRSFCLPPKAHANFYWVLATRLLANIGIWSVFAFLRFYLESVVGLDRAAATTTNQALLGGGAVVAVPASLISAHLARRYGIVLVVAGLSWIMAAAAAGYVLIALSPDLRLVIPLVLVFSAAYGAYGAADWSLALEVMPNTHDVGKDMGIWHVAMVLPQIIGPFITGWLITWLQVAASPAAAYAVAFALAAFWFALAASLVGRIRIEILR